MTNINYEETTDYKLAFKELTQLIASLNQTGAHDLLSDLLTDAERMMLVKRFAAVLLFNNDYSSYRVSGCLGISISTAQRIQQQYDLQKFHDLLTHIKPKEQQRFYNLINDLILAQASPKARARLLKRAL